MKIIANVLYRNEMLSFPLYYKINDIMLNSAASKFTFIVVCLLLYQRLYLNPSLDVTINPHPIKKFNKKSNFNSTLEYNQPPSYQKIWSKSDEKKSNFTCTLEYNQPPFNPKIWSKSNKKFKLHLYTRVQSTPIQSKSDRKKSNFPCTLEYNGYSSI